MKNSTEDGGAMQEIKCAVLAKIFASEESGYRVVRAEMQGSEMPAQEITLTGYFPQIAKNQVVRVQGQWKQHPRYGRQFQVESLQFDIPDSVEGLEVYLGSGILPGVGPALARRIVKRFRKDTISILDEEPDRLREVHGIGRVKHDQIKSSWSEQRGSQAAMIFLYGLGIKAQMAMQVYQVFGEGTVSILKQNPYLLIREIKGLGFKRADAFALRLGIDKDDPRRSEAGIIYCIVQASNEGHCYLPANELIKKAGDLLGMPRETVLLALQGLLEQQVLTAESFKLPDAGSQKAIYLPTMHAVESEFAASMMSRCASMEQEWETGYDDAFLQQQFGFLTQEQFQAVANAMNKRISILTGGPGTGKTTAIKAIVASALRLDKRVGLVSPTGRAAKRLSEAAEYPASTIHRHLGYQPHSGWQHDEHNLLADELVIIDEASMLDIQLAQHLLCAIHADAHIVLVGDPDQLPSVGPGDVLRDLIQTTTIATVPLTTIFRQEENSLIILNAHRINRGESPELSRTATDFFLFAVEDPERAAELLVDVVRNRIPERFGYNSMDEVQVLAPMYRGYAGINQLNLDLQAQLNPQRPGHQEIRLGGSVFRMGDKVMQTSNNYDKQVFNGEVGRVVAMDREAREIDVAFPGRKLTTYIEEELEELILAYCISIHKSQGSEYPCVVIPLVTEHYPMLRRKLLYTAVTRAQKLVVLIGSRRALDIAVKRDQANRRYTGLRTRLQAGNPADKQAEIPAED